MNRTSKGLHAALLGRTTSFNDKELCTQLKLDTAGSPVAAARAVEMAATHAAHQVVLKVRSKEPAVLDTPASSARPGSKDQAWLDTMFQPWLTAAASSTATGNQSATATAAGTATATVGNQEATATAAEGNQAAAAAAAAAVGVQAATTAAAGTLETKAAVKQPTSLKHISSITLTNLQLRDPFPASITQAFPHLQHCTIRRVQWSLPSATRAVIWPHLTSLKVAGSPSLDLLQSVSPINFPLLTKLQLGRKDGFFTPTEQMGMVACCAAFSKQLTCIKIRGHPDNRPASLCKLFHQASFPQLTSVHVTWKLTDVELRDLLSACPSLKHLHVGSLVLKEQYGSEYSSLEQLIIDVWADGLFTTLSLLPRTPKINIQLPSVIDLSEPIDSQAIAAVMGHVHLRQQGAALFDCKDAQRWADTAVRNVQVLCPLLLANRATRVVFGAAIISEPLLKALVPLGVELFAFGGYCTWVPGVAASFWSHVPCAKRIAFLSPSGSYLDAGLDQIALICCTAMCPVTVQVLPAEEKAQCVLMRAVQAAGKEGLVRLVRRAEPVPRPQRP